MNRPTEYQTMKRLLFWNAENVDGFTRHEANLMIYDSVQTVYDNLPRAERAIIREQQGRLMANYPRLGDKGSLELLASVAPFMEVK